MTQFWWETELGECGRLHTRNAPMEAIFAGRWGFIASFQQKWSIADARD
jgi:hypothetical protein